MLSPDRILRRLRSLFLRRHLDADLDAELRFHLEMEATRHVANGIDADEAHRRARRDFGGLARHRDDARDARGVGALEDFVGDLRVATRLLRRQPTYTAVAIATLAVGIGSATAIFGAVHGVLLAPLPYPSSDDVVVLWQVNRETGSARDGVAPANFLDWQARSRTIERMAVIEPWSFDYVGREGPEVFEAALVSEGFFQVLAARPLLGRGLDDGDFAPGRDRVVVISEETWRTRFSADSGIVGQTLVLDSTARTVVGVMPRGVDLPHGEAMWAPRLWSDEDRRTRVGGFFEAVGRLRSADE